MKINFVSFSFFFNILLRVLPDNVTVIMPLIFYRHYSNTDATVWPSKECIVLRENPTEYHHHRRVSPFHNF